VLHQSGGGFALFAVCVAIWVSNGATGHFWPMWVLIFVLIPLLRGGWALYGPAPDLDRLEADLNRRAHGHGDRHRRR
jgi:hypothetical protein